MNKHPKRPTSHNDRSNLKPRPIPPTAYIQAHEAQLVYGPEGPARAEELYSKRNDGRGMMRWQGDDDEEREIWADRHDIIHLLSDLPSSSTSRKTGAGARAGARRATSCSPSSSSSISSSSSWDSIPSDMEETFHLSDPIELEAYERSKRIKRLEMLREARLKEREGEDKELKEVDEKGKGKALWPENEIPAPDILKLMSHTATALYASPNPQILESRILLNHAQDPRFEFLRGRWGDTWQSVKRDTRAKKDLMSGRSEREKKAVGGLIGGYESDSDSGSDSDSDSGSQPGVDVVPPPPPSPPPVPPPNDLPSPPSNPQTEERETPETTGTIRDQEAEAEKQRQRRLKAEEWKRNRAQAKK